ncbi:MAG: hypothetical protein AAFQ41_04200 [Cyanobacteria bacterium J06623_7]
MKRSQLTAIFSGKVFGISLGALGIINVFGLAASADVVGNQGIRFSEDTIVEFEFIESHGAYQSTFGIIDLDSCQTNSAGIINFDSCTKTPLLSEVKASDKFDTVYRRSSYETDLQEARNNDFLGTPGDTVPDFEQEFIFEGNKRYAFYLESEFDGKPAGTVYTTDLINARGNRQALFNEEGLTAAAVAKRRNNPANAANKFDYLVDGGLLINFDDTGSTLVKTDQEDVDFDDFIVGMGGGVHCNYGDVSLHHSEDTVVETAK